MTIAILTTEPLGMALGMIIMANSSIEVAGPFTYVLRGGIQQDQLTRGRTNDASSASNKSAALTFLEDATRALIASRPKVLLGVATKVTAEECSTANFTVIVHSPRITDQKLLPSWLDMLGYSDDDKKWTTDQLNLAINVVARPMREWADVEDTLKLVSTESGESTRMKTIEMEALKGPVSALLQSNGEDTTEEENIFDSPVKEVEEEDESSDQLTGDDSSAEPQQEGEVA